jgi:tRNA-dihydrouridine synthase B
MHPLPPTQVPGLAPTALAPMQDVTTLPFMRLIARYGAPDFFFTEYFRVYPQSRPERHILASVEGMGPLHPVFAQIIGEDLPSITRTMEALQRYPVAGIDLNLGCPAPKVYKKNVGGGLLRDFDRLEAIVATMRAATTGRFTVKMRLGFDSTEGFLGLVERLARHDLDLLTLHGRTVKQMYRGGVDYALIAEAKRRVPFPVLANGNIASPGQALAVLDSTGVDGLMIGRGAIRNPWIFRQIREALTGREPFTPRLGDVRDYVEDLWETFADPAVEERSQTHFLKKFLSFVGEGVDPEGGFLKQMRRANSKGELFAICEHWMGRPARRDLRFAIETYAGVIARPNHEGPATPTACGLRDEGD